MHQKAAALQLHQSNLEVKKHNELFRSEQSKYLQELNHLSHLTKDEFVKKSTGLIPLLKTAQKLTELPEDCRDLPASKNWVEEGKVSAVKNQFDCASSFLQSAVSALESAAAIEYDSKVVELSSQHPSDCLKNMTNGRFVSCVGGRPEWIWKFSKDNDGLVALSAYYNYTGTAEHSCRNNLRKDPKSAVETCENVRKGDEEMMKCRVARFGPVVAGITSSGTMLRNYKEGIFDDFIGACTGLKPVDHVN